MLQRDYGEEFQFLPVEETREKLNSRRYFESMYDASALHFHPLKYALMLAGKATARGAALFENSASSKGSKAWCGMAGHDAWRGRSFTPCGSLRIFPRPHNPSAHGPGGFAGCHLYGGD